MLTSILLAVIGGVFGGMLVSMGYPINTWEYWVMIGLLFLAIMIR